MCDLLLIKFLYCELRKKKLEGEKNFNKNKLRLEIFIEKLQTNFVKDV